MEPPVEPPPAGSTLWRWVLLDAKLRIRAHGHRQAWPFVADLNAVADEIMAERVWTLPRDRNGRPKVEKLAGLICRAWHGGAKFNKDKQPVDERGNVVPYGESRGDDWISPARAA